MSSRLASAQALTMPHPQISPSFFHLRETSSVRARGAVSMRCAVRALQEGRWTATGHPSPSPLRPSVRLSLETVLHRRRSWRKLDPYLSRCYLVLLGRTLRPGVVWNTDPEPIRTPRSPPPHLRLTLTTLGSLFQAQWEIRQCTTIGPGYPETDRHRKARWLLEGPVR